MIFYFPHSLIGNALGIASGVLIVGKCYLVTTPFNGSEFVCPDLFWLALIMGNDTVLSSRNASKMVVCLHTNMCIQADQEAKMERLSSVSRNRPPYPFTRQLKVNRSSRSQNTAARFMMPGSDKQGGYIQCRDRLHRGSRKSTLIVCLDK